MFLYRKYIYIEIKSIFENLSMFENFSILLQSLKGVGEKCNFAPATDHALDSTFVRFACDHALDSTYYLKSSLINCLRLWFFRRFERTYISAACCLTLAPFVARVYIYLNTIIKKATKIL